mgnify:FL=1
MAHRYPIGIQTFECLREDNLLYIDKTDLVYRMTHDNFKYVFLSRPRRFGKSLLVSTLRSYFEGRKDLFTGLAIEGLEKEWKQYPVIHFNMADGRSKDEIGLESYLSYQLSIWEREFEVEAEKTGIGTRLASLIRNVYLKAGENVVVLIDEYDAPLLDVAHEEVMLPKLRKIMRDFYAPLKGADPFLRFVFLTGITKFSQLSIFSELNNIKNISMLDAYAPVCGITQEELLSQMDADIGSLAEACQMSKDETIAELTLQYDGYHFSAQSPDIFNPYSLLNCFADKEFNSYWFGTGTPIYLIEMMRKFGVQPTGIASSHVSAEEFDAPTESMKSIIPLLYQSGYVTIKGYDRKTKLFSLDIPNNEVRVGLMQSLSHNYLNIATPISVIRRMGYAIQQDDMEGALSLLQTFFQTVPYCDNTEYEGHWQQMLYVVFSLFGAMADVELHTMDGRVDMAMLLSNHLYLFEIKLNGTAEAALAQIDRKRYSDRFALSQVPVTKVGINFVTQKEGRGIDGWLISSAQ